MAKKKRIKVEAQQRSHELAKATVKCEIERRHTEAMKKEVAMATLWPPSIPCRTPTATLQKEDHGNHE
jgi:hypothetical protein